MTGRKTHRTEIMASPRKFLNLRYIYFIRKVDVYHCI
jgi:hypothetical protein